MPILKNKKGIKGKKKSIKPSPRVDLIEQTIN